MQSESQWTTIGYCKLCHCAVKEKDGERLYTGPNDCNCELQRLPYRTCIMTPKQKLLNAIEGALALGRSPVSPNMMQRLNEQLGKIKSLANDIKETDDGRS